MNDVLPPGLPVVEVVPATIADLTALATDRQAFAQRMGSPTPGGWPEFPAALAFTIDRLSTHPQESEWWMHFFLVNGLLVGSGGFVGRPRKGEAEIGYEIAPGYRRRHYGTGAAAALVEKAFRFGEVKSVIAHTMAQAGPATRVLERLGFVQEAEVPDPAAGTLWRWRLKR
ncbi:MAG: GNAT family N-acetyltransferase [Microbacteriaceae bacterium]|nr:GNAT family N-acetyltransferase [Microbacteriaceae bacterium]